MGNSTPRMMLLGIVMAILGRNLALAQGMGVYGSAPDTHTVNMLLSHQPLHSYVPQYMGPRDSYSLVTSQTEESQDGRPKKVYSTEECRFHGQYLLHPDEPCQYLLCTSSIGGWRAAPMPCPPGMAAKPGANKYSYPCRPDAATCPALSSYGDPEPHFTDPYSSHPSLFNPNTPSLYDNRQDQHTPYQPPKPHSPTQYQPEVGENKPEVAPRLPQIPDFRAPENIPTATLIDDPSKFREVIHGVQDDISHTVPQTFSQTSVADPVTPERRVLRLEEPGVEVVLEETRMPGYQQRGRTVKRTKYEKTPHGNGDLILNEERTEVSMSSSTHESSGPISDTRPHRIPELPVPEKFMMTPNQLGYPEPRQAPLQPRYQMDLPKDATRVIKRSYVHMPNIPSSLLQLLQTMRNQQ